MTAPVKTSVFWDVMPCILVYIYTFWNMDKFVPLWVQSHCGREYSSILCYGNMFLAKFLCDFIACDDRYTSKVQIWNEADITWWDLRLYQGVADVPSLLRCDTVTLGEWFPTFWGIVVLAQWPSVTSQKTGILKDVASYKLITVTVKYMYF
jgi:hypothetical protein